jgi:hypothetical protein
MVDLRELIARMAYATLAPEFAEASALIEALDLEMTYASIAPMKRGNLIIRGATLNDGTAVHVIAAVSPTRELVVLLQDSRPPYRTIEGEAFGSRQRIQKSRVSDGFAVVFHIDGLEFALTADSPDDVVSAVLCNLPDPNRRVPKRASEA